MASLDDSSNTRSCTSDCGCDDCYNSDDSEECTDYSEDEQSESEESGSQNIHTLADQLAHISLCPGTQQAAEIASSPLLTVPVLEYSPPAQYGLIGAESAALVNATSSSKNAERLAAARIFHNVAAPSSVFICGSQGSGKSNTLACLLENCLIPSTLNTLPKPLTGIVFHYDSFSSDAGGLPCEAAYLASSPKVKVRVLCAPTNIRTIRHIYRNIPNVTVEALQLSDGDLNTKRMLDLMAVGSGGGNIPLYMHVVNRVLRDMRMEQQQTGGRFIYQKFKDEMFRTELTEMQLNPLKQRLDTLESFMVRQGPRGSGSLQRGNDWTPKPGQLTIVDLSCPCVTAEMACSLFNITLHLSLEGDRSVGRVVALDEAHKYMKDDAAESRTLADNLLSIIRLQRHLGVRVIVSTQEPTISPKLLDLCSVTIVHRFSSPDWLKTLRGHLAGVSWMAVHATEEEPGLGSESGAVAPIAVGGAGKDPIMELFALIVSLRVGQAVVFAPSAIISLTKSEKAASVDNSDGSDDVDDHADIIHRLAHRALRVQIRSRLTKDGGRSIMAS